MCSLITADFSQLLPRFCDDEERARISDCYVQLIMVPAFDESVLWISAYTCAAREHTLAITLRIDWPSRTYTLNARFEPRYHRLYKQLDDTICEGDDILIEYTLNENYELVRKGAYGRVHACALYIIANHKLRCLSANSTESMEAMLKRVFYLAAYNTPPSKVDVGALPSRLTELLEWERSPHYVDVSSGRRRWRAIGCVGGCRFQPFHNTSGVPIAEHDGRLYVRAVVRQRDERRQPFCPRERDRFNVIVALDMRARRWLDVVRAPLAFDENHFGTCVESGRLTIVGIGVACAAGSHAATSPFNYPGRRDRVCVDTLRTWRWSLR